VADFLCWNSAKYFLRSVNNTQNNRKNSKGARVLKHSVYRLAIDQDTENTWNAYITLNVYPANQLQYLVQQSIPSHYNNLSR